MCAVQVLIQALVVQLHTHPVSAARFQVEYIYDVQSAGFVLFVVLTVVTIRSKPVPLAQASHELRNLENHLVTFGQSSWDNFKVSSCTAWLHITIQRGCSSAAAALLQQADQDGLRLSPATLSAQHLVNLPCSASALSGEEACMSMTVLSHLWMRSTMRHVLGCALESSKPV